MTIPPKIYEQSFFVYDSAPDVSGNLVPEAQHSTAQDPSLPHYTSQPRHSATTLVFTAATTAAATPATSTTPATAPAATSTTSIAVPGCVVSLWSDSGTTSALAGQLRDLYEKDPDKFHAEIDNGMKRFLSLYRL
ncbi:hypothetical protein ACJ41O_007433 [Fusarium nematophilum]